MPCLIRRRRIRPKGRIRHRVPTSDALCVVRHTLGARMIMRLASRGDGLALCAKPYEVVEQTVPERLDGKEEL